MGLKGSRGSMKPRGQEKRRRRAMMVLSVEGSNKTERQYFSGLADGQSVYTVRFAAGNDTDPEKIVTNCLAHIKSIEFDATLGDVAYCVFDTDVDSGNQGKIDNAIRMAGNQAEVILSNPCFEFWFLCHFTYTTKPYSSNQALLNDLKRELPSYEKNKDMIDALKNKTRNAIKNARDVDAHHLSLGRKPHNMQCNPSTAVYRIVEHLIQ